MSLSWRDSCRKNNKRHMTLIRQAGFELLRVLLLLLHQDFNFCWNSLIFINVTRLNWKLIKKISNNMGAMAIPNLAILTIWKPLDGTFEKSLGNGSWLYYQRQHSDLIWYWPGPSGSTWEPVPAPTWTLWPSGTPWKALREKFMKCKLFLPLT